MTANVPLWVSELAERFWQLAEQREDYPRQLREACEYALSVEVVDLPNLCVASVREWLTRRNFVHTLPDADRPLHGCLYVTRGNGYILLEALDDLPERRFTLAHELAHYLYEYWYPRQQAV